MATERHKRNGGNFNPPVFKPYPKMESLEVKFKVFYLFRFTKTGVLSEMMDIDNCIVQSA